MRGWVGIGPVPYQLLVGEPLKVNRPLRVLPQGWPADCGSTQTDDCGSAGALGWLGEVGPPGFSRLGSVGLGEVLELGEDWGGISVCGVLLGGLAAIAVSSVADSDSSRSLMKLTMLNVRPASKATTKNTPTATTALLGIIPTVDFI